MMFLDITHQGRMEGGFWGFRKPPLIHPLWPFDSKAISTITSLSKYMIINILASYAYLSANTI